MGDMLDLVDQWWQELRQDIIGKCDEVPMKLFIEFALRKRILIDEKELETLFKDLCGNQSLADLPFLKHADFLILFSRACFRSQLSNLSLYLSDSSPLLLSSLPFPLKLLAYQRDLIQAGLFAIGDASMNKRGLDGRIVKRILEGREQPEGQLFSQVKKELIDNY